ncbi:MAG: hypothetical protein ABI581_04145 [Sediminibacterium sp.]
MKLKIQTAGIILFLLMHAHSFSQNVDGHWFGVGIVRTPNDNNNYMSELVLLQKGKTISGSLQYYFKDSLVKVLVNGSYDHETHKLRIRPFSMIYYLSPNARNSIDVNMSGDFTLLASKTESVLTGALVSDAEHRRTSPPINFRFKRSTDTTNLVMPGDEPDEIKKDTIAVAVPDVVPTVQEFTQRPKVFTKVIEVDNSTLRLEIYDNGEVDGDEISLFLNNKRILVKSKLTHRAIRINIELDPTLEYNELSMFAENLGMIPPNTAALILYDGKTRYETLLSSDLNKSATLKLKKKK